jgi:hypothetical protein
LADYAIANQLNALKEAFGEWVHIGESGAQRCKEIVETAKLIFQR